MKLKLPLSAVMLILFVALAFEASAICEACTSNADCSPDSGVCFPFELDGRDSCTASCAQPSDCPSGYFCIDIGAPSLQCFPDTTSCVCDGSNVGLLSECQISDPNDPQRFCTGVQACTSTGWSACDLPLEVCADGLDNDCDGLVDENNPPAEICVPAPAVPTVGGAGLAATIAALVLLGALAAFRGLRPLAKTV